VQPRLEQESEGTSNAANSNAAPMNNQGEPVRQR